MVSLKNIQQKTRLERIEIVTIFPVFVSGFFYDS